LCSLQPPPTTQIYTLSYTTLFRSHAVRQDESAGAGGQDHVDGPRGEVLGDDGPEPLREGGLGGDQGLLDVLARVLARGEQDVVIGVVGARALENLQVDLFAHLGIHHHVFFARRRGHRGLLVIDVLGRLDRRRRIRMTGTQGLVNPKDSPARRLPEWGRRKSIGTRV